jgi:4a-hydroxytetrahydrobiopterin dehydratase
MLARAQANTQRSATQLRRSAMPATRLSPEDIDRALSSLPGWRLENDALVRDYKFRDFVEAYAFMTACALRIQEMDHHPEWSNVYNGVHVRLTTHDANGITARDAELAAKMEALATRA